MSWLNWYLSFAAENIYGFIPILAVVYAMFFLLRKLFKKLPHPGIFVGISFFICLFTIPSMPRYTFENDILSKYKNAGEYKLVNSANWGALVEPITLIKTPIGFFHFVSPIQHSSWKNFQEKEVREYRSQIHRYSEPTISQLIDADCSDNTISISEPREGVFKYISFNDNMSKNQKKIYCETDYSFQVKMYQCKYRILSKLSKVSEKEVMEANEQCKSK